MSNAPPILEARTPTDEDDRLVALFDKMEGDQLDFLDQAGKRIIELCTGLLAVLFAVIAFGDKFPPAYLKGNEMAKGLILAVLALYLAAILVSVWAVQPREYKRYRANLTEIRRVLDQIIKHKAHWLRVAGVLFVLGSLVLAGLIVTLVLTA